MPRLRVYHQTTIESGWIVEAPDADSAEEAARLVIGYGAIEGFDGYPELPEGWEYTEADESYRVEDGTDERPDLVTEGSVDDSGTLAVRRPGRAPAAGGL